MGRSSVDIHFAGTQPVFGDLLAMCGVASQRFPANPELHFDLLESLQLDQIDDYFGVRVLGMGAVVIWLFPIVGGEVADHHPGPFERLNVEYNHAEHTPERALHWATLVARLAATTSGTTVTWCDTHEAVTSLEPGELAALLRSRRPRRPRK